MSNAYGGNDIVSQMLQYIMDMQAGGQTTPYAPGSTADDIDDQNAARARATNLYQDQLSIQADTSNSALAGAGAYAPGAFDPTMSYQRVDTPGYQQLMAYAARGPQTPEGFIAQEILNGSTASAAIASLQQAYATATANGTLDAPENAVLRALPTGPPSDFDGSITPDWNDLSSRMTDVESAYMTDPSAGANGGYLDPDTGQYVDLGERRTVIDPTTGMAQLVDVTSTPSEQEQWYRDQGLSLPTDSYTAADLLDPSWQGQDQAAQQAMQNWYNSSDDLHNLFASINAASPNGKSQFEAQQPNYGKGVQDVAGGGGGDSGGPDMSPPIDWSKIVDRVGDTPIAGTNAMPPIVNQAITAAQLAPDVGSWWARNGASPQEAATGITGALGGFLNDIWNSYAGNDQSFGQQWGNEKFDAEGNPVNWDPTAPYETAVADRIDQSGAVAPPQGQDPTGLISDDAWAAQQANRDAITAQTQGGGSSGGSGYGFGGGQLGQLNPQLEALINAAAAQMTGIKPMGGQPPMPPDGGSGAITNEPVNQGYGPNGTPPPNVPPGGYIHNGAIFDANDRVVGYVAGAGQPQPQPQQPQPTVGIGGMTDSEAPIERSQGQGPYPQLPAPSDSNTLAMLQQMLTPTQVFENQRQQQFAPPAPDWYATMGGYSPAGPTSNASTRTGPEPSDQVMERPTSNASTRTGPEPSDQVAEGRPWWERIGGLPTWWEGATGSGRAAAPTSGRKETAQVRVNLPGATKTKQSQLSQQNTGRRGPGKRNPNPDTPETRQGWQDFWAAGQRAGTAANQAYGYDYGRAAAAAYLLGQQGITPLSTQLATRRRNAGV